MAPGRPLGVARRLSPHLGGRAQQVLRPRGLPIGNLTSQFLANVFLDPLDHFVKEELCVKGYVRYADDLRVFSGSKERLHHLRREIEGFLAGLRLVLHEADAHLDRVRFLTRLVTELGWLSGRQYEFAAGKLAEIGRLVGGWRKATGG